MRATLTSYHQSHRLAGQRVLRGEIAGRHLALPVPVVELNGGGAHPQ